jgi:hypothetical protein
MSEEKTEQAAFDEAGLDKIEAALLDDIKQDEAAAGVTLSDQPAVDEELRGLVGGVLTMGFAVLAPNWNIQPVEVEQLTESYTMLLCKYCPDGLGDYGVEISAVMITAAVFGQRVGVPRVAPPEETRPDDRPSFPDVMSDEAV